MLLRCADPDKLKKSNLNSPLVLDSQRTRQSVDNLAEIDRTKTPPQTTQEGLIFIHSLAHSQAAPTRKKPAGAGLPFCGVPWPHRGPQRSLTTQHLDDLQHVRPVRRIKLGAQQPDLEAPFDLLELPLVDY